MITKEFIFFHEDNYCQIELLSIQNLLDRRYETETTREYSEQNLIDNGFVTLAIRPKTKYPIDKLNIDITKFKNLVKKHALFYFTRVYSGYSSQQLLKNNIHAFGFENYILYCEFRKKILTKIWLDYSVLSDTLNCYPENLHSTLLILGTEYDLILIDWNELLCIILKNDYALKSYIDQIL